MSQPEVEYDGKDYNIRPAYHLKKWKKKKHFVQQIYVPDRSDLSVTSSIGTQNTGHSSTTFSHIARSLNPHHRLYTVPITADVILEQNTDHSEIVPDIDATKDRLFHEYLSIASKPNFTGLVDDHVSSGDSIQKVNPLPKDLMGELSSSSSRKKKNTREMEGGMSRALLNELIDEIQGIEIATHDAQKGSHTIADHNAFEMWKKAYSSETGLFGSVALFVETQYCELIEREESTTKPTKLKAVVISDLLMKLIPTLECHSKLIGPLIYELLNFVFVEYPTSPKSFSSGMSMEDFSAMHTYFDRFIDYHSSIAEGDEEIDYIKLGSQMNELVRKFQTVSLVFDIATRFLRDACFSKWKSLMIRDEHYRRICIRKMLKYRFMRMKAYKRTHINAEQESIEHAQEMHEKEMRLKQFQAMFQQKKMRRRSIRNSIRQSMVQIQTPMRTHSRGSTTEAEIRAILRSRSGNEPISNPEQLAYANAIANAIAAASPLNVPNSHSRRASRVSTPGRDTAVSTMLQSRASSPQHSPLRGATNAAPSPLAAPSDDDPLFDFRVLTVNVIPPYSTSSSGNPTPYARSGPDIVHTHSIERSINPSAKRNESPTARALNPSPHTQQTPAHKSPLHKSPPHQSPVMSHRRSSRSTSVHETIPELEAAAMAAAERLVRKDCDCQTPAEWVNHEPLPKVHKLRRQKTHDKDTFNASLSSMVDPSTRQLSTISSEAVAITASRVSPFKKPDFKITPHGHAHVSVNRDSIETAQWNISHQKYQLSFSISSQLVSYVYSSMFPEQGCTHPAIDFSFHNSLLSYTKELLLYKYKVPSVADKFYKGLIACCLSQSAINNRILLFARLCGITSTTISAHSFDPVQYSSFVNMLGILFKRDPWEIRNVMNSKKRDIYRKVVLSVLYKIVPTIHVRDPDLFQHLVNDIQALPVTNSNIDMKVLDPQFDTIDIDDLLLMLMEYLEIERSENMELQMEKMKEKLAQGKKTQQLPLQHLTKH